MSSERKARLTIDGHETHYDFPVLSGTHGPDVIDISALYKNTKMFSIDPGYLSTASCTSSITFVDGDQGQMLYRGYPIEDLADSCSYMQVSYLLIHGELPTQEQLQAFEAKLVEERHIPESTVAVIRSYPVSAHPVSILIGAIASLAGVYVGDLTNPEYCAKVGVQFIAKLPVLVAMVYRYVKGLDFVKSRTDLYYTQNFMHMMFSESDQKPKEFHPDLVKALDVIFTLHADHEQNASTSTLRMILSSGANPFAAAAGALSSLWGAAHGGANEAALNMLREIADISRIDAYVKRAKDKNDSFRLMGFGHRVYKNYDPRAKIIRKHCHEILSVLNLQNDPLFRVAMALEKITLEDDYFVSRKLYPNVDFYSGIAQSAIGIPSDFFICIFALARVSGWAIQMSEMLSDKQFRISRPRQLYVGPALRHIAKKSP